MGKFLEYYILLVYSWIGALFILMIPASQRLHNDIISNYKMYAKEVIQGK